MCVLFVQRFIALASIVLGCWKWLFLGDDHEVSYFWLQTAATVDFRWSSAQPSRRSSESGPLDTHLVRPRTLILKVRS